MAYGHTLGVVVAEVKRIEDTIQRIEQAMRHASPATIDALRMNKEQLTNVLEFIMELDIKSNVSLTELLTAHRQCLQQCIDASYTSKKPYMGRTRII